MKLKLITMALALTTIIGGTAAATAGQHKLHDDRRGAGKIERGYDRGYQPRSGFSDDRQAWQPRRAHALEPYQVERHLRHRGYRNVRVTDVRRGHYIVRARGHQGPVLLTVSRHNAAVLDSHLLRPHRGYATKQHQKTHRGGSIVFHFGG
ncbi:MAG: hypothetical protein WA921_02350 [Ahrensia sp.]